MFTMMEIKLFNKNFAMVLNHVYNDVWIKQFRRFIYI